jgi:hypothetical protein
MSRYKEEPMDFSNASTYPLGTRHSKVASDAFAKPVMKGATINEFIESLPRILAADDLRELAKRIRSAREQDLPVIAGLGGHVIKTGLAPILIDLMSHGSITAFALNGAAMIHDFEIALAGATSEDVEAELGSGRFGMAEETGRMINEAIIAGSERGIGMGESLGRFLGSLGPKHADKSLLFGAYEAGVPVTVHVAIGTDITHMHPGADGAAIGQTSHHDFKLLCTLIKGLNTGGVYINLGSAVILPEVFLKAITIIRNLGHSLTDFTTANFDFIQHYRPVTNVVRRPVTGNGRGFAFTGHHEILIPLLAAFIKEA